MGSGHPPSRGLGTLGIVGSEVEVLYRQVGPLTMQINDGPARPTEKSDFLHKFFLFTRRTYQRENHRPKGRHQWCY